MVVLHYTGMPTGDGGARRACAIPRPRSRPTIWSRRTAASSPWSPRSAAPGTPACRSGRAQRDINAVSIGVEIVNPGHECGYRAFPDAQIEAVIAAARRHPRALDAFPTRGSSAIPTSRPRASRIRASFSLGSGWPTPATGSGPSRPPAPGAALAEGDEGAAVFALQAGLTRLGYELPALRRLRRRDRHDRHRLPAPLAARRVDGAADGETRARLMALLRPRRNSPSREQLRPLRHG